MYRKILLFIAISQKIFSQIDTVKTYYDGDIIQSISYKYHKKIYQDFYHVSGGIKSHTIMNKDSIPLYVLNFDEDGDTTLIQTKISRIIFDRKHHAIIFFKIKRGIPEGKSTVHEHGILSYEMNYKNGLANGEAIGYNIETKEIIAKETYLNGKLNGEGLYYKRGKILQRKIFYKDGCPVKAQTFDATGEVVYETIDREIINKKFRSTEYCK